MYKLITCIIICMVLCSCSDNIASKIEKKHGKSNWPKGKNLQMEVEVVYKGKTILDGTFTFNEHVTNVRAEMKNGTTAIFDGKDVWISPNTAEFPRAKFHLITWPWFLLEPLKMSVSGSQINELKPSKIEEKEMLTVKQTFAVGSGDSPDDWYIHYINPQSYELYGSAYAVTYGKTVEKANEDPHFIKYENYKNVDGVLLSTKWSLWHWNKEKGIYGEKLGDIQVKSIAFVKHENIFEKPDNAKKAVSSNVK